MLFDKSLKLNWTASKPPKQLEKEFLKYIPQESLVREEHSRTKWLRLADLDEFASKGLFEFTKELYQTYLFYNGAKQRVHAPTKESKKLIKMMHKKDYKKEHLQVVIRTDHGTHLTKIISGKKRSVSNLNEIVQLINKKRLEL